MIIITIQKRTEVYKMANHFEEVTFGLSGLQVDITARKVVNFVINQVRNRLGMKGRRTNQLWFQVV